LLSLAGHGLVFWPGGLRDQGFGVVSPSLSVPVQAVLKPALSTSPTMPPMPDTPVRQAIVTQSSSQAPPHRSDARAELSPVQALSVDTPVLQATLQQTAGLDAGAVRAYRVALARALATSGLREGLGMEVQGSLELGLAIAPSGQVREVGVIRGSGVAALDAAVVAAMRRSVVHARLPSEMLGREFVLGLPIEIGPLPAPAATAAAGR
jgi:TonB family protein